jgi:DNA-binding Xre family transcriptional regulator
MSDSQSAFHKLRAEISSRPGAEERISADVERMTRVLELEKLRTRKKLSQTKLAELMGLSQRRVSAIEHTPGADLQIDTVRRYVEGLGGTLEITAVVDGDRIPLPLS